MYQRPIRVAPVLLVGPPGIGKTYFTDQLAKNLEIPIRRIAMDNFQTGAALAGSSYIWSNREVGEVFRGLVEGDHASPLVILDEIDKANDTFRHHGADSLSALHNLLEPASAKYFKDASFPLSIDASHIISIATANDISKIPETLLSRMDVFEIKEPTSEQYREILEQICWELAEEYPDSSFDDGILDAHAGKHPESKENFFKWRSLGLPQRGSNELLSIIWKWLPTAILQNRARPSVVRDRMSKNDEPSPSTPKTIH